MIVNLNIVDDEFNSPLFDQLSDELSEMNNDDEFNSLIFKQFSKEAAELNLDEEDIKTLNDLKDELNKTEVD